MNAYLLIFVTIAPGATCLMASLIAASMLAGTGAAAGAALRLAAGASSGATLLTVTINSFDRLMIRIRMTNTVPMPIKIQSDLPARTILENENIFVMTENRANTQDIRPLKIAIVNLMPTKETTETQLLRLLGNTPLQIDISLVRMENHESTHVSGEHLERFYIPSSQLFKKKWDGMIITGAPVEQMPFEDVDYWSELCDIMDFATDNVYSTLYICWGAYAGLYHNYGIKKLPLDKKAFGIYKNHTSLALEPLLRGFDDEFPVPTSRHTTMSKAQIQKIKDLQILAENESGEVTLCK